MKPLTDPNRIANAIFANVDAWYADEITYAEFGAIQKSLWDQASSAGVANAVTALVKPSAVL